MDRPRLLFYAMYDPSGQNSAPKVRIRLLSEALAQQADVTLIEGGRWSRPARALSWLRTNGWESVDAVYVESPTAAIMPLDLAVLAWARAARLPVGVYFRDAYQLFRELFPAPGLRQRASDLAWRLTSPRLRGLATVCFAPSLGLARALRLPRPVILPPGTDPSLPELGIGEADLVAAIVPLHRGSGFETLVAAVEAVRESRPGVRLRVIPSVADEELAAALPAWVEVVASNRSGLPDVLRPARVCVLPLPVTAYTDLAVPVRLMDLLSFGKPIVSTDSAETHAIIAPSGAGLLTPDSVDGLAAGIEAVLADEALARQLAATARALACSPEWTWADRARAIVRTLVPHGPGAAGSPSGGERSEPV